MNEKRKILIVVNSFKTYLWHRQRLAIYLKKNYKVTVISSKEGFLGEMTSDVDFEWIDVDRKGKNPLKDLIFTVKLLKTYLKLKPDIVHHFTIKPVIYGSLAAKLAGVPLIVNSITGMGLIFSKGYANKLLKTLVALLYKFALGGPRTTVIFQNPDDREYFQENILFNIDRSFLIKGSGVDIDYYIPTTIPNDSILTFLFASRMLKSKGVYDILEASRRLKEEGYQFRVLFAGEPDLGSDDTVQLSELKQWHNEKIIEYLGFQTDVKSLILSAHVICLPSYYAEGIPMILLEALSCGKPIITTDSAGCREVIKDNGFLVPIKDPAALKGAMKYFILNRDEIEKMGKISRRLAEDTFSTKIVFEAFSSIYRRV